MTACQSFSALLPTDVPKAFATLQKEWHSVWRHHSVSNAEKTCAAAVAAHASLFKQSDVLNIGNICCVAGMKGLNVDWAHSLAPVAKPKRKAPKAPCGKIPPSGSASLICSSKLSLRVLCPTYAS